MKNRKLKLLLIYGKLCNAGLILPQSEIYKFYLQSEIDNQQLENSQIVNYKFLHDRVQQAAYSLIPENQKQATHYQIGQLLKANISNEALESQIFELLSQLNAGINRITYPDKKQELAHLNLIAARKAKLSAA
ncbi:MAG: hypothetical protein AAFW70_15450 [Cyanobacteria bacterium J06635_10]